MEISLGGQARGKLLLLPEHRPARSAGLRSPRLRARAVHARSVRIVAKPPGPGQQSRNFGSLFAVKIPRKAKSCSITSRPARGRRAPAPRTALTVTTHHKINGISI
jgi:hypothetical protein